MNISEISERLSVLFSLEAVSFDVFDTLLYRRQGSFKSFLKCLGAKLHEKGMLDPSIDPEAFVALRLKAEKDAHMAAAVDNIYALPLKDIYDYLPAQYRPAGVSSEDFEKAEYEYELESAYTTPTVVKLLEYTISSGRRVCITSNTYYSRAQLTHILRHIGIPESCLKNVFCSSEFRRPKHRGLFEDVLANMNINPNNLMHVGDNKSIDFDHPTKMGIRASHLHPQSNRWFEEPISTEKSKITDTLCLHSPYSSHDDPFEAFGYEVIGPIVLGFADWLAQKAERSGRKKLLFAEREGIFLKKIMDQYIESRPELGLSTEIISVSRLAVMHIGAQTEELDLQIDSIARQMKLGVYSSYGNEAELDGANKYFGQVLADAANSIFVDIGYKGTINKYLNDFVRKTSGESLPGAYLFHSEQHGNSKVEAYGYLSEFSLPINILSKSFKGISFLEQCFMPSTGSVSGFDKAGTPQRAPAILPERQLNEQLAVQKGAQLFQSDLEQVAKRLNISCFECLPSTECMSENLIALFQSPSSKLRFMTLSWCHEVNFGSREIIPISAERLIDISGYSKELLGGSSCWQGSLHYLPFMRSKAAQAVSSGQVVAASDRGVFFAEQVKTTHAKNRSVLSAAINVPQGEKLQTLRVESLKLPANVQSSHFKVSVHAVKSDSQRPSVEAMALSKDVKTLALNWSTNDVGVFLDNDCDLKKVDGSGDHIKVDFNPDFDANFLVLHVEAEGV